MRRIVGYIAVLCALVGLWGCPAATSSVEWGEVVYAPHFSTGFEIVATEGSSTVDDIFSLLPNDKIYEMADLGAYNGDTAKEFLSEFTNISRILAVEPDPKTFRRLCRTASGEFFGAEKIEPINAALGSHEGECIVHASGNRNTSLVGASYEYKEETIPALTIDKICEKTAPDFIKLDIEGEELNALLGAVKTIREYSPALLISLYHRSEDIFSLILYMRESYPNYRLYLRRIACVPAWEIDLLALPT